MSGSLILILVMAVLYACGIYLLLERSLTRMLLGFLLVGNATNLLILIVSGPPGAAPFFESEGRIADPLPQAFMLTAIVITFGISAFLMALIYRSWRLARADVVADDTEDRAVGLREKSVAAEPDAPGDETEFGIRATAAVTTAIDLDELERREDAELVEEQRLNEERERLRDGERP